MKTKKITRKKGLAKKVMKKFDQHGGGTAVEAEYTNYSSKELRKGLQNSFDKIFPELVNKANLRKHVIFDQDVFETYDGLAKSTQSPFSVLINQALRRFAIEKLNEHLPQGDPVAELHALQKRERELIEKIKAKNP